MPEHLVLLAEGMPPGPVRAHCFTLAALHCAALQGPCPNCGTVNTTYFGDILTVAGSRDKNTVECSGCRAKLTFNAELREVRGVLG